MLRIFLARTSFHEAIPELNAHKLSTLICIETEWKHALSGSLYLGFKLTARTGFLFFFFFFFCRCTTRWLRWEQTMVWVKGWVVVSAVTAHPTNPVLVGLILLFLTHKNAPLPCHRIASILLVAVIQAQKPLPNYMDPRECRLHRWPLRLTLLYLLRPNPPCPFLSFPFLPPPPPPPLSHPRSPSLSSLSPFLYQFLFFTSSAERRKQMQSGSNENV